MTIEGVGALLTLATTREESRPCNIALSTTAGITPNPRIQLMTFTTSPPMIPTAAAYEMSTSALKTPVLAGRKFIRRKNHGILLRVESGLNATPRLPTLRSALGTPIAKDLKGEQIGGRKGRAGTGTMGAATVGEQTTQGNQDPLVTLVASLMIGSAEMIKMTVLSAMQKTGYGSLLRRGSHGVEGVAKAIAVRTTDDTRIGTGAAGAGKKVGTTTNKDGISDLMIVISTS